MDISDPRLYSEGPPHEAFQWLRDHDPVSRQTAPSGQPYWAVTRYSDIRHVNRLPEVFRSGSGISMADLVERDHPNSQMMIHMDPPRHLQLRGLVQPSFTPKAIGALEAQVVERTRRIVDVVCERGECDLVSDIATQLPLQVISALLGIPDEDYHLMFDFAMGLGAPGSYEQTTDPDKGPSSSPVMQQMATYANDLAEMRRADPGDDLVSRLVTRTPNGEPLSQAEFIMFFIMIFVAGFDTTRHSISNGLEAFMANPSQWEQLVRAGTMEPSGVEEVLRWATPIMYMMRTANEDTVVADREIAAGDRVVMWYISGNRDERAFEDPFRFDINRPPTSNVALTGHQAFGGGGPHYCLGHALARLEVKVMFEELARRMPDVEPAGPVVRAETNFFNVIRSFPIRFSPSRVS